LSQENTFSRLDFPALPTGENHLPVPHTPKKRTLRPPSTGLPRGFRPPSGRGAFWPPGQTGVRGQFSALPRPEPPDLSSRGRCTPPGGDGAQSPHRRGSGEGEGASSTDTGSTGRTSSTARARKRRKRAPAPIPAPGDAAQENEGLRGNSAQ